MATILLFLLLPAIFTAVAQQGESIVKIGSFLTPTTNSSCFLAGIPEKTVVWIANRDDPPVLANATLNFTTNGTLIMQSAQGKKMFIANPPEPATSASMLDSGNFVLHNSDKKIIWQRFDYPTNTILQGQCLSAGTSLRSSVSEFDQSTGIFQLVMQTDGNLGQYPLLLELKAKYAYWSSNTNGQGNNVSLCLDDDGHLYLLNSTGTYLSNLTQGGYPRNNTVRLMRIDVDGIFRLYSHNLEKNGNWLVNWSSSDNKCDSKGLCGLNGFCTTIDRESNCLCLPGFARVHQGNRSSGCERNFTAESCESRDGSVKYTMVVISNTVWEDSSFSILSLLSNENCQAACLEDCNCEAATYKDGTCRKQKLPLRFGKNMTNSFKEELGKGSFGTIYKGTTLTGQKLIAVKRLDKMKAIGRTHDKNLVHLLGYCHDGEHRLLVYEFISNGSLADILFTPEKQLRWDKRIEIARNIVKGILYLYEECGSQIIHCDIKSQNILMDKHECAKISDFGLAKLLKPNQTSTFTSIWGTKGYVALEWHRKKPMTVKADVYSFGIVLLELICCTKSLDWDRPEEEAILEEWANYCFKAHELGKLVGDEEVDKRQLERMVKVGPWCVLDEPSLRPSMRKVLLMLEGTVDIPIPPSSTCFLSKV
ncbi:hypothetical protein ACB092_10G079500 [Castanea dentata]